MKKILLFIGTRPEAVKMVPVLRALRVGYSFEARLAATGQHREMLAQALADFGETPDINLDVMTVGQSLAGLSARLFEAVDGLLALERPAAILAQGDTTTVQVAALCAFYRRIPVGHVEAGLRSRDLSAPFPEELNRRIAGLVSTLHFAPTNRARDNLLAEGVPAENLLVTGNTVIDALLWMREQVRRAPPPLPARIEEALAAGRRIVLVTGHRRENFGEGFRNICAALRELALSFQDARIVYPVHLNPQVRGEVLRSLGGTPGVILEEPLTYKPFVRLMDASHIILTDSGGIQEEGPSLGKPVLVMREVTERPEGVEAGVNKLVGTDPRRIVDETTRLLKDDAAYGRMAQARNPYGDGHAAGRIADFLRRRL
ncbi:MAG: UDP-N-acetylglucosamine 2-epimerase (non-hydrolyzing) [Deltaproteobacteria bacterium]|jgi:UDP-N-acetylglucosamine 2-epimerase|nr:UDP-N-acetylglucosamine 2-epimerase (non-hydrolyzing) [Deltaproteobacteria bacterium]